MITSCKPGPSSCSGIEWVQNWFATRDARRYVDVFSPNRLELLEMHRSNLDRPIVKVELGMLASYLVKWWSRTIVVRAGECDCFITSKLQPYCWLPACHESVSVGGVRTDTSSLVTDSTGAGNAFWGLLSSVPLRLTMYSKLLAMAMSTLILHWSRWRTSTKSD